MDTVKIKHGKVNMIAHRGLSGIEPQNTLRAFIAAGNRSYYGIETDIHRTKDGKFVCIHDGDFKRVAGREDLLVEEMTFDEARSVVLFDTDGKPNSDLIVPSLQEYILVCKRYEKIAVLELKSDFTKDEISEIIGIISELEYLDNVVFISFNYQNLVFVKELKPEQQAQFLVSELSDGLYDKLKKYNLDLDINYKAIIDNKAVKVLKKLGIKVNVWTVDKERYAKKLIKLGVDFITTNILE